MATALDPDRHRIAAQNRKARHDFFIQDTLEAGIMLQGSEVKSLRKGHASIGEAFAAEKDGDLVLVNAHIPEYEGANRFNHEPNRPRKLLLHKRELNRLIAQVQRAGVSIVPLSIYFNDRGIAKVSLGIAKGKRKVDKRQDEKARDWQRDKARLMREKS
jgi:SsrA-binding protein